MRMTPPQRSAFRRRAKPHPKRMPNVSPIRDRANETKPIMPTGDRMVVTLFMPRKANDTPTARASMLVATASISTTFRRVGSKSCRQSSSLNDSRTMRPPRKARMAQAGRVEVLSAIFFLERFVHHASPQKGEDGKGNPVVYVFDEVAECASAGPSDEGHQCLKKPEEEGHYQHRTPKGTL